MVVWWKTKHPQGLVHNKYIKTPKKRDHYVKLDLKWIYIAGSYQNQKVNFVSEIGILRALKRESTLKTLNISLECAYVKIGIPLIYVYTWARARCPCYYEWLLHSSGSARWTHGHGSACTRTTAAGRTTASALCRIRLEYMV